MRCHLIAIAIVINSTSATAQSLKDIRLSDLISTCHEALDAGFDAEPLAAELYSRKPISLGTRNAVKGAKCLEAVYGAKFLFSNQFYSPELDEKAAKGEAAAELRELTRSQEYLGALVEVCTDMYSKDRFLALTTELCGKVFRVNGLPN